MTLVAVAANRFPRGLEAPGTRKKIRKKLDAWTYDWRGTPGSEANTAEVRPDFKVLDLEDALARTYATDAHLVSYVVQGPDGHPLERQPRVNKSSLDWLTSEGYELRVDVLIVDVDNPDHTEWTPGLRDAFDRLWSSPPEVLTTCGVYLTRGGYRLLQPLDEPLVAIDAERTLLALMDELEGAGIEVDRQCKDWTRLMRLPNVRRSGKPYESPLVDLSRMVPRLIRPKASPGEKCAGSSVAVDRPRGQGRGSPLTSRRAGLRRPRLSPLTCVAPTGASGTTLRGISPASSSIEASRLPMRRAS